MVKSYFLFILLASVGLSTLCRAQTFPDALFNGLRWRCIGPHRGGRTIGACGVPTQPNVFYIGVCNGGIWKTDDYGRTWNPIFDSQATGSIGDVAVAPSNPNVVYAASGEGVQRPDLSVGNGIYKSTDGGKTWTHLGFDSAQQIGGLSIDPKNDNRVFAAVLGHPYGPNVQRGVFRTLDGGKTWERVLYKDENTGAIQVAIDPQNADIVYADLYASRLAPWENGEFHGSQSGLYKSTDGGTTWKQLTKGLPGAIQGLKRIGFCIAPSNSKRLYATVMSKDSGGLYRSDDAGENWKKMSSDYRLWDRGDDFAEVKVDPKNEDIVYDANVVVWKSVDGGKTWNGFKGAPGGDDYHRIWINPYNTEVMLVACDQGGIVTVNGGQTFSSWYNQPTAQFYHVVTDNAYPYNVYGCQQESGSIGIASRGNDGEITFRDWHSVAAEEYGYVAPDPLDPNIIYGGKISRYDKRTGQVQDISPEIVKTGNYRFIRTAPVMFSPTDPKTLYYAGNVLFKTYNGGHTWSVISPDLTREVYDVPNCIGIYKTKEMATMKRRGVIYSLASSPIDSNTIWVGTDDGLIQLTKDGGKTWKNVSPPGITAWSKVSIMEAGHRDVNTAFAAVNRIRLDDMHPHIYYTHDGGQTWKEIVNGLPNDPINVVREDPERTGLLFAGSERAVYVSFDMGDNWQSLRLNMPATSVRDLVIKDDDIVVGTHGRSFWILDNIQPLRQVTAEHTNGRFHLFTPAAATRVRWNMNPDTPLPGDEPAGQNPPDGAMIDYYLKEDAHEVRLDIYQMGYLVRHYSSNDTLYKVGDLNIPRYWIRPQQILATSAGGHRFLWDLHYQPLNVPPSYPISAVTGNTAPEFTSPWVLPGIFDVSLTVDGEVMRRRFNVVMDPRLKTDRHDLQKQHDIGFACYEQWQSCLRSLKTIKHLRRQLIELQSQTKGNQKKQATSISIKISTLLMKTDSLDNTRNPLPGKEVKDFNYLLDATKALFNNVQGADLKPTATAEQAAHDLNNLDDILTNKLAQFKNGISALNSDLKENGLKEVAGL